MAGTQESSLALLVPSDLTQHFVYHSASLLMCSTGPSRESVQTHGVDSAHSCLPSGCSGSNGGAAESLSQGLTVCFWHQLGDLTGPGFLGWEQKAPHSSDSQLVLQDGEGAPREEPADGA